MSLARLLSGRGQNSENFINAVNMVTPKKEDFIDYDGGAAFQKNEVLVESTPKPAALEEYVLATFKMLARIGISKYTGTPFKLSEYVGDNPHLYCSDPMVEIKFRRFPKVVDQYLAKQTSADTLIPYCFLIACILNIRITGQVQSNNELISKPIPSLVIDEVSCLFEAFENTFISLIASKDAQILLAPKYSEIITSAIRSEVILDFVIDDSIYLIDLSSSNGYNLDKARELASYYILHLCDKVVLKNSPYHNLNTGNAVTLANSKISKLVFYKARLGCIEYADLKTIQSDTIKDTVKKMLKLLSININDSLVDSMDISF